jgi:AraC-like DNA-binding protein
MQNWTDFVKANPDLLPQYSFKGLLFLNLECPPDFIKADEWTEHNCFLHILGGKKRISTREESITIEKGSTVFVKKGAITLERIGTDPFCVLLFYFSDEYLKSFMKENSGIVPRFTSNGSPNRQMIPVCMNPVLQAYYDSVIPYFTTPSSPSESLLELKFRELLLNIISDEKNREITTYFCQLTKDLSGDLRDVMENNCFYNLQLHEYARLCHRSLSSYKRDFQLKFGIPPGRWLLERRLRHATELLHNTDKSVSEIVIESGFTNISHFDKVFKQYYGLSPLQYRKQQISLAVTG